MKYGWSSVAELQAKLTRQLEARHAGLVTRLSISLEGDTLILRGEVASEDCKGDAKRLLLSFNGVFKVRNELVVIGFLEPASDHMDDYFTGRVSPLDREVHQRSAYRDASQQDRWSTRPPGSGAGLVPTLDPVEVMRHPAIRSRGLIAPGNEVEVEVDLIVDGQSGTSLMSLGHFPSDWQTITVRVQLFALWATEMTVEEANVTISADGKSRSARFKLIVSNDYVVGSPAPVQASFLHGTRVCGHLSQDLVHIVGGMPKEGKEVGLDRSRNFATTVAVVPGAIGPSLSVSIVCTGGGQQIWMWTAKLPSGTQDGSEQINLAGGDKVFAETLLRTCPNLEVNKFRRTMAGIGEQLWAVAPACFRSAYLGWRSELGPNFPIQFASDDPHVPWEMMKPDYPGVDHLFLDHPVARWPLNRAALRRHTFPGGELLSFVPKYGEDRALPLAEAEGEWVSAYLHATSMVATRSAFLSVLDGKHSTPVGILHFAGHGEIDTGIADGGIHMEDDLVGVGEVNQSKVVLGCENGTLVVLNACETSSTSQLLGMNTGWGNAIASRGFGGLIAPLWAVQDDVALAMVKAFLPPLINGKLSLGEAVTAARHANRETSISAFAYLAHGDVMARFARS